MLLQDMEEPLYRLPHGTSLPRFQCWILQMSFSAWSDQPLDQRLCAIPFVALHPAE